jgi:hypothetical protein
VVAGKLWYMPGRFDGSREGEKTFWVWNTDVCARVCEWIGGLTMAVVERSPEACWPSASLVSAI